LTKLNPVNGPDGLGIKPGKVKHVWLIILENKSFDATWDFDVEID
jgi:hypothetical protein